MLQQFRFFGQDIKRVLGRNKFRIITIIFSRVFWGLFIYRIERAFYLLFGKAYEFIRIPFTPLLGLLNAYSNLDIHYKANIKGGLKVLHPAVGVVISGLSDIGYNLTLTGGNVIGARPECKPGDLKIGNNCSLGANAVVLGPIILGNNITVGASACVLKNFEGDNVSLVGVPAKPVSKE